jgi:hypothetical protein
MSRLVCYAVLAVLAVVLLILVDPASAPHGWAAMQSSQGSVESHGFDASQVVNSASTSIWMLRGRMHNTWLFLYVFLAVWAIVLAWGLIERSRLKLEVGRQEVYWMGWMSLSVISTAILYGIGTNGIMVRRYPRAVPISDVLAIGFVLALPVFAWGRLHRRREEELDGEEPVTMHHRRFTTLQLDRIDSLAPPVHPQRDAMQETQMEVLTHPFNRDAPRALTMVTMDGVIEPGAASDSNQPSQVQDRLPESMNAPGADSSRSASAFREHLGTLNESWARIEQTGQEIERWFDRQRQQVIAHLEKHPGARESETPAQLSKDFLNVRLAAVDAEWASIRKAALEISRWFGDAPAANS